MPDSTRSSSTTSVSLGTNLKKPSYDAEEYAEEPSDCTRCKHYAAIERALESIETPSVCWQRFKWFMYTLMWMGLVLLFVVLVYRKQMCEVLDRLEKDLM